MPPTPEILRAFAIVGGRARQVLIARLLERRSREQLAASYGISVEAADVLLFRGLAELEAALRSPARVPPPAEPLPDREERAAAWALGQALDRGDEAPRGPPLETRLHLCRALRSAEGELRQALVPPPSPPATRSERARAAARRLLWLAFVAAAAVLYSRWSTR